MRIARFFLLLSLSTTANITASSSDSLNFIISPDSLRAHVTYLSDSLPARKYSDIFALTKTINYIKNRFDSLGLKPSFQNYNIPFSSHNDTFVNIIAQINPENPRIIVIGAHYDVCGDNPGADDNASGIAGLLEAARFLSENGSSLDYQIQLVAYSTEEPPFFGSTNMGSHFHAESLKKADANVILMVCLEMIGYFTDEPHSQSYPLSLLNPFFPSTGDFIALVSNFGSRKFIKRLRKSYLALNQIPCIKLWAPSSLTGTDFSDHRNFWRFGFPAIMITDTAFYRNKNYHSPEDISGLLDYRKMAFVMQGLLHFLFSMKS